MAESGDLQAAFKDYCTNKVAMACKDMTRMFTDAGLFKRKVTNSTSLDIAFAKHKTKGKNVITFDQFEGILKDLFKDKYDKEVGNLAGTRKGAHLHAVTSKTGGVDRMTDTSKYTGAHKERFDASGKGKGAEGRTDKVDNTGYVANYKGEGSHGKK